MTTATFDTLKLMERLEAAGVPHEQAKVHVQTLQEIVSDSNDALATKNDLRLTESKLETAIAKSEASVIRWVVGIGALQALAVVLGKFIGS